MLEDLKTDSEIWEAERLHPTHGNAFIYYHTSST